MKKRFLTILVVCLLASTYAFSQQEPGQNNEDLASAEAGNQSSGLPKFLVGLNVGVGGCFSTMPSRYEEFVTWYDPQNADPKTKGVFVYQFAISGFYFFSDSLGLKFELGYATFGSKQEKTWSNAEIYYKQTDFNYIQIQVAPTYRSRTMYLWLGLNFGIKMGTPKFELYDSFAYHIKGEITKANSSFVGLTVGWGFMFKTGGVYFPFSVEFKYNFTTSGLNLPYGTDQNHRFYAVLVNLGILFNL